MNIFALDSDKTLAAQYHVSKHVVKMILEHCQLLSTAHRILDGEFFIGKTASNRNIKRWKLPSDLDNFIYTATHVNHPSAIWTRECDSHYVWLAELTKELCTEYTFRYGKIHRCQEIGLVDFFINNSPKNISKEKHFRLPDPAMPDIYKVKNDVVQSYRNYYNGAKTRMANWDGKINSREKPYWYTGTFNENSI